MVEQTVQLRNASGLHARPAAQLVQAAGRHECEVRIRKGSREVDAKSILGVMSLAVSQGDEIVIAANGPDEEDALRDLVALVEGGIGES